MIKGVLLDISGVLSEGGRALAGAVSAVERLRAAGLPIRFLTNTTRRPKRRLVEELEALGMPAAPEEVFTPVAAARVWLDAGGYAPHLLIHPDLEEDFADCRSEGPVAVVIGDAGRGFSYDRLNAAFRALAEGAPLLALARNRVFNDANGALSLDAGPFVAALEYASGTEARLFGKPAAAFFEACVASLGCAPAEAAMVGDDAESDIAGALTAGLGSGILVRSGKYRSGDEDRIDPKPTAVVDGIGAAADLLLAQRQR
jgi:HAD superfamily hydrolase (TIGR01458 family)